MKQLARMAIMLAVMVALAGCKIDESAPTQQVAAGIFSGDFGTPDPTAIASFRQMNRLAVGILYLQDTANVVTKDQASKLLPLWQEVQARQPGNPPDPAKMESEVAGIRAVLTSDQLNSIDTLTQDQETATLQKYGIQSFQFAPPLTGTPEFGTLRFATPGPGTEFPTLSPDQLATAQAGKGQASGQLLGGDPLVDAVVKLLQSLVDG